MARNAIESDFVIQNGRRRPFCEKKSKKLKVAYLSKMTRNAIESDFRSFKIVAGGHFVKKNLKIKKNLCIHLK